MELAEPRGEAPPRTLGQRNADTLHMDGGTVALGNAGRGNTRRGEAHEARRYADLETNGTAKAWPLGVRRVSR